MKGKNVATLPFVTAVDKPISRMKEGDIVDILNITFRKMSIYAELVTKKMKGVKCFCLRLSDGRDFGVARQLPEANEVAACVLQADTLRGRLRGRMVEHQRSWAELLFRILLETAHWSIDVDPQRPRGLISRGVSVAYTSMSHSWLSV